MTESVDLIVTTNRGDHEIRNVEVAQVGMKPVLEAHIKWSSPGVEVIKGIKVGVSGLYYELKTLPNRKELRSGIIMDLKFPDYWIIPNDAPLYVVNVTMYISGDKDQINNKLDSIFDIEGRLENCTDISFTQISAGESSGGLGHSESGQGTEGARIERNNL